MLVLFAVLGVSLVVALLAWAIVTGFRIWGSDQEVALDRHAVVIRRQAARAGASVPVGAREIRQDQEFGDSYKTLFEYELGPDGSSGVPPSWFTDLWMRRN
ncbi:MAG: hypothetical protein KJO98_12305 [Rhodothermia bacterium]|nr:hypothetical protein [Rhodothermia bacterium]